MNAKTSGLLPEDLEQGEEREELEGEIEGELEGELEGEIEGEELLSVQAGETAELEELEEGEEAEEIELTLDELLRHRLAETEAEGYEEGQEESTGGRAAQAEEVVHARGADEFVCRSCFLIKNRNQLADPARSICKDCADPT